MIIKHLEINGFLGRRGSLRIAFHDDINIVTGFNGAGKTNLLKLIWYTISGNTYALLNEVEFSSFTLFTNLYTVRIVKINHNTCRGVFSESTDNPLEIEDEGDFSDPEQSFDARDKFDRLTRPLGSSIFFPTFRRIEGGFTINSPKQLNSLFNTARAKGDLPDALAAVSRKLSNEEHTFVTSVSTVDIAELLLRHFNEMSQEANDLQTKMSQDVIKNIREFRRDTEFREDRKAGSEAIETLKNIQTVIEDIDLSRDRIMAPMNAVQTVVRNIFKHKGIELNRRVSFGDTVNAISSDLLSAGEKQMLSFICYNAFINDSPIIIDEPELSLHVDWQRILFPTLLGQQKDNQFIIATHSPFIYGKFPEKEIRLAEDRGGEID